MSGQERFELFYQNIYGERWTAIYQALQQKELQVSRMNTFVPDAQEQIEKLLGRNQSHPEISGAYTPTPQPERSSDGLLTHYIMDPASIVVAQNLPLTENNRILDMCAAPGGKSLILAERMDSTSQLICNELSNPRRERLTKVIQQYIPRHIRERVWVTGKDAVQFGLREPESFDAVLLDAPCSGERHLLESPKDLSEWKESRTKGLAQKQYALAAAALLALKSEGYLMYSTCSISPLENDGVIEKLLKKKSDLCEIIDMNLTYNFLEKAQYGYAILPDRAGFGPMYFSLIKKK